MYKRWTQQEEKTLKNRYKIDGPTKLAKILDRSCQSVFVRAGHLGLRKPRPVYSPLNLNIFNKWSDNLAWFLGYLWADGCIMPNAGQVTFSAHKKDKELLNHVKKILSAEYPLRIYHNCNHLALCSTKLVNILQSKYEIKHRKSHKELPFPHTPKKYLCDFIRGYFDGDGCASSNRKYLIVSFAGRYKFIKGLQNVLCNELNIRHNKIYKIKNEHCSIIQWHSITDIKKIYSFMYPKKNLPCLKRKRHKIYKYINQCCIRKN